MDAVIIAGGLGTRARAMTGDRMPQALLPVAGVPIIFHQMRVLRREGVTAVTVLAGHLGEQLRAPVTTAAHDLGLSARVIVESEPLGTAGCLTALPPMRDDTMLVYGDMLFDIALDTAREFHVRHGALLTIIAHPNDHPRTSDLIAVHDDMVSAVMPRDQRATGDYRNLVPTGLYLAAPGFFPHLPAGRPADIIHDVVPTLLQRGAKVTAYNTPEYIRDTGSMTRHAAVERDLASGRVEACNRRHLRPAIIFDCDGVLNEEPGGDGVVRCDGVKLLRGAGLAVKAARDAGCLTVIITNRAQVARGLVSFAELDRIFGRLEALLADSGGVIDRLYFCPHHPDKGFPGEVPELKIACECRKPGTLLFRRAFADLPIDVRRSAVIGDSVRDIGAGRAAGLSAYGVRTGYGCRDLGRYPTGAAPRPDLMFTDASEAVDFCVSYRRIAEPVVAALRQRDGSGARIVAVAGRAGAGKSILAHAVARTLGEDGIRCLHVRLDNLAVPVAEPAAQADVAMRNGVDALPAIVAALREGRPVTIRGNDPLTCGAGGPMVYDPADCAVILVEGRFAAHPLVRRMLDLEVFVDAPEAVQRARFTAFYRWQGLAEDGIEALWAHQAADEGPRVDAQRAQADLIVSSGRSVA